MIMKRTVFLFVVFILTSPLYSQHIVGYVVLKDNQWINPFNSTVDMHVVFNDSTYNMHGNCGDFIIDTIEQYASTDIGNDTVFVNLSISNVSKEKQSRYTSFLAKQELTNVTLLVLNIKSDKKGHNLSCYTHKHADYANTFKQPTYFAIDGNICHEIDSIYLCKHSDTFHLLYDFGVLYFDSLFLDPESQLHTGDDLNLLIYVTHKCYIIPFHCSGNAPWFVFIRNTGRKKYTVGWYDGYCLRYKYLSDLYGLRGALHKH